MKLLLLLAFVCLAVQLTTAGFYLASDYIMDPKVSKTFKGVCEETIKDDFSWFVSHIHIYKTRKYPKNKDCWVRIDSGGRSTARMKFYVDFFETENSAGCVNDVLETYDGFSIATVGGPNTTSCGNSFNIGSFPTQRYTILRWKTDGSNNDKGFRIGALRYEQPNATASAGNECRKDDPNGEYFYCPSERICIDPRLQCDGTPQCWYQEDEQNCSSLEKFVGGLLSMGLQGLVTLGIGIVLGIIFIVVASYVIKKLVEKYKTQKEDDQDKGKTGFKSGTVSPEPVQDAEDRKSVNEEPVDDGLKV